MAMLTSAQSDDLVWAAREAAGRAYCPYSDFPVGAAVLSADGRVFTGCNVENASYGLTVCAERVAILTAVADGASGLVALAVSCAKGQPTQAGSLMPCGACLQVMAELLEPTAVVIVDQVGQFRMADLLPMPFQL